MRRHPTLTCALAMGASLCVHCPAQADPVADARAAIARLHSRIDAAIVRKDYAATTEVCAPGFVSVNLQNERFTAAQVRDDLAHSLARAKSVQSVTTLQTVTLSPSGATVTLTQHMNVITPYKVLFVHRLAHTTLDQSRREEWLLSAKGWLLSRSKTLSNTSHTSL